MEELLKLMKRLRDPATGCPWDKEQSFASIAPHTLEEAYEVVDAIEKGDMKGLKEELGDLLLQVVFHAQMAKEQNLFSFEDVVAGLHEKLVNRHPHIFGDTKITTAEEQSEAWETIKLKEKAQAGFNARHNVLEGVPVGMPALSRSLKLQKKAARAGFDWPNIRLAFDKLDEEIQELLHVLETDNDNEKIKEELGDMLLCCVTLARKLKVDPEEALRYGNRKFETRLGYMQLQLDMQRVNMEDASFQELGDLWDQAKIMEGRD